MTSDVVINIELNNECVSCQELSSINRCLYLLPCLHQICTECLNDIDLYAKSDKLKYKCVLCYEQFDFEIVNKINYSNNFIKDYFSKNNFTKDKINDRLDISLNKKFINDLINTTINCIDEINLSLTNFTKYRKHIESIYEKILYQINIIDYYHHDLLDDLINEKNYLQKSDLKTIDLEIETIEYLLNRHNKYLLAIRSIQTISDINLDIDKAINFLEFIKPQMPLKKSLVKERFFDRKNLQIIFKPIYYFMNKNEFTCADDTVTHLTSNFTNINKIPNSITHLTLDGYFNQDIKGCIPNSVIHLDLGCSFNQNIKDCIPNSVTHLTMSQYFDKYEEGCIPNSVTHLTLGKYYNMKIKSCIPKSVTHLNIGWNYEHLIELNLFEFNSHIPNSVTHLTFGSSFNQDIKDCNIPKSVTHLTFGMSFNQNIKGCIPNSVTHLVFGSSFNQNIKDCIPNSVKYLTFGYWFNQNIKDCIPESVIFVKLLGNKFINVNDFPDSVKVIDR
jgi:hypothetical protein